MIAPMLNGFFARTTAIDMPVRSAASSARITSRGRSNGVTFIGVLPCRAHGDGFPGPRLRLACGRVLRRSVRRRSGEKVQGAGQKPLGRAHGDGAPDGR